jgi:cyclopropane-fatty-acyl-phospholipid synthase
MTGTPSSRPTGPMQRKFVNAVRDASARSLTHRLLSCIQGGAVTVHEHGVVTTYGTPLPHDPLHAHIAVSDSAFYRAFLKGSLGLAQSYAECSWDVDDLVTLIRIGARNMNRFDGLRRSLRPVVAPIQYVGSSRRRNTIARSVEHISAHYDVGNELYGLFLDETMMYSSAVFGGRATSLYDAQIAKLDRICGKLDLRPGDHLLELGTGWGGLAVHAAREYGARVTTATISKEQHAYVVRRVKEEGLEDRVSVLLRDYRNVTGKYDKLVSVEMIEAVGWRDFPTFFGICSDRLVDDGVMLLQAITMDDRAYDVEKATSTFIKTAMFPGGCLPSVEVISRNTARHSDMRIIQLEDITPHYVSTLEQWRERFAAATDTLGERGYDARFRRRWSLYLAYCEAGFRERRIQDVQVLLAKPEHRGEFVLDLPAAPRGAVRWERVAALADPRYARQVA